MVFGLGERAAKGEEIQIHVPTPAEHTLNLVPLHSMEISPVFSFHRRAAFELTTPITAFGLYEGGEYIFSLFL